jgi:hypothetical protein
MTAGVCIERIRSKQAPERTKQLVETSLGARALSESADRVSAGTTPMTCNTMNSVSLHADSKVNCMDVPHAKRSQWALSDNKEGKNHEPEQ